MLLLVAAITSALGSVIGWVGTVVKALVTAGSETVSAGALYPLLPLFAIGVAVSVLMFGIKAIRGFTWGA